LFISALGQINNCENININFEILEDLYQRNIIDDIIFHDLSFAVAFACHIRLHQYMTMQGQYDIVDEYLKNFFRSEKFKMFVSIASRDEFAKFFETVLRLQTVLSVEQFQNINLFFSTKLIWPKLAISFFLGRYDDLIDDGEHYLQREDLVDLLAVFYLVHAYQAKGLVYKSIEVLQKITSDSRFIHLKYEIPNNTSFSYDRVLFNAMEKECNERLFEINHICESGMKPQQYEIICNFKEFFIFMQIYITPFAMKRYHEALSLLNKFILSSKPDFSPTTRKCNAHLKLLCELLICPCLIETNHVEQALHRAFEFLELYYQLNLPWQGVCFLDITACYSKLGHIKQAMHYNKILQNRKIDLQSIVQGIISSS